jgi:hypothetical protein
MDDNRPGEIEEIVRRYRPPDPPRDLRDRIMSARIEARGRVWPWAVAAAALLATVLTLYTGSAVSASTDPSVEVANHEMVELNERLGTDVTARDMANWIVRIEHARPEEGR